MTVHVVGAGLSGLAAATALAERGAPVEVSEAAAQAGGRCRSYFDAQVGLTIDNGNHLVLSGNMGVRDYLSRLGAEDRLVGPAETTFPFVDLASDARWTLRPNPGPLAWWIFASDRAVPGARLGDYLKLLPLAAPPRGRRVDQVIDCQGPAWERLMEPFLLAALNMDPKAGAAELAGRVIRESLALGGAAYAPRVPSPSLAAAFIEPALDFLVSHGATVRTQRRLIEIGTDGGRVTALKFSDGITLVSETDQVVLAVPPWVARELAPGLSTPDAFEAIVNGHFRIKPPAGAPLITGVLGATVQWVFCFEDRVSVTVSGANGIVNQSREALAKTLWDETARVLGLGPELPPWQIVKEKRATFEASVEQQAKRPGPVTPLKNLVLAGDWTATGLPATIEGAVRSGFRAADLIRYEASR